ncbi:MAG: NAD(P)/FAD-dependent oxidoreductase [Actinomycetota bacterium]|jgi:NADH dehydrogenase|nr:NAD(P)/FAD-dependent oxidoreductase [Actinomycetota bacterium]
MADETRGAAPCPSTNVAKRVVIVGGGYAGTTCAVTLGRRLKGRDDVEILLIEPDPCQQALSELDMVAVGPPRPQFCELWHPAVFRKLPVRVCYNRVTAIHPEDHTVTVGDGQIVPYWRLVVASGAVPVVPPIPGLRERTITMWSVEDAQELQRQGEAAFKHAAKLSSAEERRRTLSFTVVGGGATGVEIVGTMGQLLPKRLTEAGLDAADLQVNLVEGRTSILYDLPEPQRAKAVHKLESMGVTVHTGSMVDRVEDDAIVLASGARIDSAVLVWCGGAKADPHAAEWGFEMDASKRLVTEIDLKALGFQDAYVIGDVASFRNPSKNNILPMLAQMAIQQGPHVAMNLLRELDGRPTTPFLPHMRGEFVSVGPSWGVGWMYGMNLTGLPAIIMKRITYVKYWLQVGGIPLAWKRTREMLAMQR